MMAWPTIFVAVHVVALAGWLLLCLGPRGPKAQAVVLYAGVGLLCLAYAAMILGMHGGWLDAARPAGAPPPDISDYNIAGLQNLFVSEGGLVLGWTHYLALDLFTGLWIAKDADHKGFSRPVQLPVLLLTFAAGPLGLLVWLAVRERRARARARG